MNFFAIVTIFSTILGTAAVAEPKHGIAMYGEPALPPDFVSLPYVNANAPKGGAIVQGEVGSFDSLNPHIRKGRVPWQLRFLAYESLMGRSWDEPFTLYGLLAESVETAEDRSWVEFTLRPEARFSDGSPVTVEDVLWSYETLGTVGHPRYHGSWKKVETAEAVGERTVRFTFNVEDDELALIMGLRPILKKAQWDGIDFAESGVDTIPISTAPYVITDFEAGRFVLLERDADYWGNDLNFRRGTNNLDQIRMEFFADGTAMFEAFKGGILNTMRETNVQKWDTQYGFPAVTSGDVLKSIIPHKRPTGIQGLVFNTRKPQFQDWRVREALITAFNFEFINTTINGDAQPRISSYFANSVLGASDGPAEGKVAEILSAYGGNLLPGAMEGYSLPVGDGTERNRANLRKAIGLMEDAGWTLQDGVMKNADGETFTFEVLLSSGASEPQQIVDIFSSALGRMGITPTVATTDSAQYKERTNTFDFDMTWYRRGVSLSPGNEQLLYWGTDAASTEGSRNWAGITNPAIDGIVQSMLTSPSQDDYRAAVKALDRVLISGRYVIPVWHSPIARIAHAKSLKYPADTLPMYGDWIGFQPDVWWSEE
ncbi:MAG: extracellular solute-binding protein [Boseongicola sp.]|nr:extracellular solute-binding protein [Boseongicola sp.]MDD9976333.1 extracellular solute-binding protein [Boseongicola sp.]